MNEKIQAILLSIILELKKLKWAPADDWEISLHTDKKGSLTKKIPVQGSLKNEKWNDHIEILMELTLNTEDRITYFPKFSIYGHIFITSDLTGDIVYVMDDNISYMEDDVRNTSKFKSSAANINRLIKDYVQSEYTNYIGSHKNDIDYHKSGGRRKEGDMENDL
jgi:hypothetical protein